MKALFLILVFCISVLHAQEIQGIINYQLFSGGVNITLNKLKPIQGNDNKTENHLSTRHKGFYAGYSRNTELLQLGYYHPYPDLLDTIKISRNNLYLGYMKRWGYGKRKIEPFLGIQTDVVRWGKDIDYDKDESLKSYFVYSLDDYEKNDVKVYYNYNLYSGLRLLPFNFSLKYGFDLNISKKIAFNATGVLQIFKGIKNVNSPYFSGSYLSLGLRYSIINKLKR